MRSPPLSSAVFSWRATRFLQTTQVCINLWLGELFVAKVMVSWSAADEDFFIIFRIFLVSKAIKTEKLWKPKKCIFGAGRLKTAVLVQKP